MLHVAILYEQLCTISLILKDVISTEIWHSVDSLIQEIKKYGLWTHRNIAGMVVNLKKGGKGGTQAKMGWPTCTYDKMLFKKVSMEILTAFFLVGKRKSEISVKNKKTKTCTQCRKNIMPVYYVTG